MFMTRNNRRVLFACYSGNLSMSVVAALPSLLFLTFRTQYGLSYSLLGLLVLISFSTQLLVDLLFSFFSHRFNIAKTVKLMPWLTTAGMLVYALWPFLFPRAVYAGMVLGTVIFAASGGLAEVLISPVVAALPSDDPDRAMSRLHSVYAWGVVGVVLVSTGILQLCGGENWQWLMLGFTVVPLLSVCLFAGAVIPPMATPERASGALSMMKNPGLLLCVAAIFLGGAAECTMAQWASGYLERALGIPKLWGDVFGVALFSAMLGLGRSLYGKIGRRVTRWLLWGGVGATGCYLIAALSGWPPLGLLACAATGFCVAMMWPGSLIVGSDRFPAGGVFVFALMAAGGDLGASVGPQLVGLITDGVIALPAAAAVAADWGLTPDQLGMKLGMLVGALFPLTAIGVYWRLHRTEPISE